MACSVIPTRVVIGLMIFGSIVVNFTMRVNLSISIIAMVLRPVNVSNVEEVETIQWSAFQRANLLGCYSWSYTVGCLIGGSLAQRYGPRKVVLITSLVSALLTFASPAVAKTSFVAFLLLRILMGFAGAFPYPAASVLIASWAVSYEKRKFASAIIAGSGGTVIAWALSGVIIETLGWEWSFYIFGFTTALWSFSWWYCVYNSPREHPRISEVELKFITDGTSGISHNKPSPPYRRIFTSVPVYALMMLYFSMGWGVNFVITSIPSFMATVLKYNLSSTGYLSSCIYLARSVCAVLFGLLGDYLLKRNLMSLKVMRKFFVVFSHVVPGCLLLVFTVNDDPLTGVAVLILSMAITGAATLTLAVNALDLAPNFNGIISGLGGTFGSVGGALTPLVVAYFTKHDEWSLNAWRPVFYLTAGLYIITGIIFITFGSTERQPWNNVPDIIIVKEKPEEENALTTDMKTVDEN